MSHPPWIRKLKFDKYICISRTNFKCITFCIFFNIENIFSIANNTCEVLIYRRICLYCCIERRPIYVRTCIFSLEFYCCVRNNLTSSILNNEAYKERHFRLYLEASTAVFSLKRPHVVSRSLVLSNKKSKLI